MVDVARVMFDGWTDVLQGYSSTQLSADDDKRTARCKDCRLRHGA